MTEAATRWTRELLRHVAVRQWVVTVPWPRRWLLARRPELAREILRIALCEIRRWTADRGVWVPLEDGRTGSITVVQRFGSALNLNIHVHILVLDGLYERDRRTGHLRWHQARPPKTGEVERLAERLAARGEDWLARRGFGREEHYDDPDDAQAALQVASVMGRSALRQGRRARRVQMLSGCPHQLPPRCAFT